jgi:hypothetical protein
MVGNLMWINDEDYAFQENIPRSCRNCTNYVRVQECQKSRRHALRGFCLLGGSEIGESDFGLYISASVSSECRGFILEPKKVKVTEEEKRISDLWYEFESKESPQLIKDIDSIKTKEKRPWFFSWLEASHALFREFTTDHVKDIIAINEAYDMSWKDYLQFIDIVSELAKRYLDKHKKKEEQNENKKRD